MSKRRFRPRHSWRWRTGVLIGIHVVIIAHIVHWLVNGTTPAGIGPAEAMDLGKHDIINVGLLVFITTILATAVFGRFFCGWGCHIVALQDQITESIVTTLAVTLTRAEQGRAMHKETRILQAYDYVLRGTTYHHRLTREDNVKAKEMFVRAIELDPDYAPAYAGLAWVLVHDSNQGWSTDPKASLELALEHARRAVLLDDGLAKAHMVLGDVFCWMKRHEQAVAEGRRAIALDPSYADGHMALAYYLVTSGQAEKAVEEAQKALRFNPVYAHQIYYSVLGQSLYMTKQYEAAMAASEQGVSRDPNARGLRIWLAATYAQLGQMDDARRHAKELLRLWPNFSLQRLAKLLPYKSKPDLDHWIDGLRKAGLPEK